MSDDFGDEAVKALERGITAFNCELVRLLKTAKQKSNAVKLATPIKYIHYDPVCGYMNVQFALEYTPDEIEFLEKVKSLSQDKLQLVKKYIDELSKGDDY